MKNENHIKHNKETEKLIIENVNKYGWHVALFESDNYLPSFGYTIGLWKNFNHPELITFTLETSIIHSVLNNAGNDIKKGNKIILNKNYNNYLDKFEVQFLSVADDNINDWFGYGLWFNDYKIFPALQLIWPDKKNKFPWEDKFDPKYKLYQPLLDRNTNFKFFEEKNLGVFTTKQVMYQNFPVLEVYHDQEDCAWQFLCGTTTNPEDLILVCLEEILKKDISLNQLFYLEYGNSAYRKSINDKWIIKLKDDQ